MEVTLCDRADWCYRMASFIYAAAPCVYWFLVRTNSMYSHFFCAYCSCADPNIPQLNGLVIVKNYSCLHGDGGDVKLVYCDLDYCSLGKKDSEVHGKPIVHPSHPFLAPVPLIQASEKDFGEMVPFQFDIVRSRMVSSIKLPVTKTHLQLVLTLCYVKATTAMTEALEEVISKGPSSVGIFSLNVRPPGTSANHAALWSLWTNNPTQGVVWWQMLTSKPLRDPIDEFTSIEF